MALELILPNALGRAKAGARADMLSECLSAVIAEPVVASVAETYAELEARALGASVDLVWCPSAVCAKLSSARGVYTIVRDGEASYRSALIALRAPSARAPLSLGSLQGARAAWVDPLSAGGYLLAVALLRARGIDPDRAFGSQVFLGTHRDVALAVLAGDADVGAVSMHGFLDQEVAAMLRWYVGPPGDKLEAFAVTERCPNDAIVVTDRVPAGLAARARAALEELAQRPGSKLLAALEAEGLKACGLAEYERAFAPRPVVTRTSRPPASRAEEAPLGGAPSARSSKK
ncbi:MAG: PhnD/SsuA/transferrin family substrate-binding protein [Polyangiaceae bacterium]